jgi:ABC-type transport system involved in cytochrome bd biosynthesis fused ATPase/permease subunit
MYLFEAENLNLTVGKGESAKIILNECSFILQAGEFVHLAGNSGVGKSSLLAVIARLLPLQAGELRFKQQSYRNIAATYWRKNIAFLPQKTVIFNGTVSDNLLYPFKNIKVQAKTLPSTEQLKTELIALGLGDVKLERLAINLSSGQQARLALARLLLTQPQIILADEPMANVDTDTAELIYTRLRQFCQNGTVLITRHANLDCDRRITLIGNGDLDEYY